MDHTMRFVSFFFARVFAPRIAQMELEKTGNFKMKEQSNGETEIRWGGFPEATKLSSLSRGTLYNLISDGLIRSRVIRRRNARGAGHRLIDLASLLEFIENSPSELPEEIRAQHRAAVRVMTKAKEARRAAARRESTASRRNCAAAGR
jgi:hypothetical protein